MFKTCTECNKHLALENFHNLKKGKFGKHPRCKLCRKSAYKKGVSNNTHNVCDKICCYECGQLKSKNMFYKNKSNKTGYQIYCKNCHRLKISQSMSKLENYFKILLKKFKRKYNKKYIIQITSNDLYQVLRNQEECCVITGHKLESNVDLQQRTDNIWNISICLNNAKVIDKKITKDCIFLVCNLVYTTQKLYNLNKTDLLEIYKQIKS